MCVLLFTRIEFRCETLFLLLLLWQAEFDSKKGSLGIKFLPSNKLITSVQGQGMQQGVRVGDILLEVDGVYIAQQVYSYQHPDLVFQ